MADPLADPRAADLLAAKPDEVLALARDFQSAASESAATATGLSAAQHDGTWAGRAADAFRRAIGRLPNELQRVHDGFSGVAQALSGYEPELASTRAAFVNVVGELTDAQSRLIVAQTNAHDAFDTLKNAVQGRDPGQRDLDIDELTVARANVAVNAIEGEIVSLRRTAFNLLDEFAEARDTCRSAIAGAQRGAVIRPASGRGTTVIAVTRS
jgi:uncharacterized protein YukE